MAKYPDPLADVRCSGIVRAQHTPFRIEPQRGQIPENSSKPSNSEEWGVFHEDEAGSHFANDPGEFGPEAGTLTFDSRPSAGGADVLAGEAPGDEVNSSTPGLPVEGSHIVPDWEPGQDAVPLSLEQDTPRVFLQLNGADWHMAAKESAEDSSACASEEVEFTKW